MKGIQVKKKVEYALAFAVFILAVTSVVSVSNIATNDVLAAGEDDFTITYICADGMDVTYYVPLGTTTDDLTAYVGYELKIICPSPTNTVLMQTNSFSNTDKMTYTWTPNQTVSWEMGSILGMGPVFAKTGDYNFKYSLNVIDGPVMFDKIYTNGITSIAALPEDVTNEDLVFIGWSETEGASSLADVDHEVGDNPTLTDNLTLYAVWVPAYTVDFNLNGADGGDGAPEDIRIPEGHTVNEKPNGLWVKSGFINDGKWYYDDNGTETEFVFGAIGTGTEVTENMELYLKWETATVTVDGLFSNGTYGGQYESVLTDIDDVGTAIGNWTYELFGGPIWLTINSSTGIISGTPDSIGEYAFVIRVTDDGSSACGEGLFTLTVDPATLTVTPDDSQNKVYGQNYEITYTTGGWKLGDDETTCPPSGALSIIDEAFGLCKIGKGTLSFGPNYVISFVSEDINVTKATLTVIAHSMSKVYGEDDPELLYTVEGLMPDDTADGVMNGVLKRLPGENVGSYTILPEVLDAGENYEIMFFGATFSVTPKPLTVTANAGTKIYNGTGADTALTYASVGLVVGDTITGSLERASGKDVGTYAILQGTLTAGPNYVINYIGSNYTITPKTLVVTSAGPYSYSKYYGSADPDFGVEKWTAWAEGDSDILLTGKVGRELGEDVGKYILTTGTLSAGHNYLIMYHDDSDYLEIDKAPLTITADAKTKVYGDADPALTYGITDGLLFFGDVVTGTISREVGENVGAYAISGTLTAGSNYDLNFVNANLTVIPATLLIMADFGQTKEYGDADPVLGYTVISGWKFSDADSAGTILSGNLSKVTGSNVGKYAISKGTLDAGDDYVISFIGTDFSITPKNVTGIDSDLLITGINDSYKYTESAITPVPVIKYGETVCSSGTDYIVSYSNNVNAGNATVMITFKGNYSGTVVETFSIFEEKIVEEASWLDDNITTTASIGMVAAIAAIILSVFGLVRRP